MFKINKHIIFGVVTLVAMLFSVSSFAQEKRVIDGQEYYLHVVDEGATLYSISKLYNVSIDEIKQENPELEGGLKLFQELKIPIIEIKNNEKSSTEKVIPEGFTGHKIVKGETLYALSKKYGIKVKDIIDNNPEVVNGLKPGSTILIPNKVVDVDKIEEEPGEVAEEVGNKSTHKIHKVKAGETLYSLSKLYEVSTEALFELNPSLNDGLRLDQELKVPYNNAEISEKDIVSEVYTDLGVDFDASITGLSDSLIKQEIYNVALLLPFYLTKNDTIEAKKKGYEEDAVYNKSTVALQFYQGALLALDSLRKQGIAVRLFVKDTDNDTLKVKEFVKNKDSIDYHLIIGPLYKSSFEVVSKFAKKNNISIVSPVPQSNKVLLGNEYVSKTAPSRSVQVERIASYVVQNYNKNENVFVVNTSNEKEQNLLAVFLRKARNLEDTLGITDSLRMVTFGKLKREKLAQHLDSTVENVIILPTIDPVYVYDFLTLLNSFTEHYSITVFGLDKWLGFSNLESDYLHELKIHVTSQFYEDYSSEEVLSFIGRYRNKHYIEPTKYSYLGFDVMYYYVKSLDEYGVNMQSHLDKISREGIAYSFDFFKTGMESGFENKSTYLLKYEDYKLLKVEE